MATGTWTKMMRTASLCTSSAGAASSPSRITAAVPASAARPSQKVARDPVEAESRPSGAGAAGAEAARAEEAAGAAGGPVGSLISMPPPQTSSASGP